MASSTAPKSLRVSQLAYYVRSFACMMSLTSVHNFIIQNFAT